MAHKTTWSFELKKTKSGKFHFILKAGNGEVVLTSEHYEDNRAVRNGILAVLGYAHDDARYERRTSKRGDGHWFVLTEPDGRVIGVSEIYTSAAGMENGIASLKSHARGAAVPDFALDWHKDAKLASIKSQKKFISSDPDRNPQGELVVEIEVPEGVSDQEVLEVVGRLSYEADDLHRALGGHGLKIKSVEIHQGTTSPVGGAL
jgi:uncharacterized protein YegP (UPF0339 family)